MPPSNTLVAVTLSNHYATTSSCYVTTYVLFTLCQRQKMPRLFCCLSYCNSKKLYGMQIHLSAGSPTCALSILQHFYSRQGIRRTVSQVKSFGLLSLPMLQDKIWARTPGYKATKVQTTTIVRSRCFCCYENNRNVYSGIVTLKSFEVKHTLYVHWVNYSPNGFMEYRTSDYTEHIQGSHTDCASMNHSQSTDLTLGCS